MPLNAHVTKGERSELNHLSLLLRKLGEKKSKLNPTEAEEKKQALEQGSMKLKTGSQQRKSMKSKGVL